MDSALSWTVDSKTGDLWLDTRILYWGKHLKSYSPYKLAKLFNTYCWNDRGEIKHVTRSVLVEVDKIKKGKPNTATMTTFNSCKEEMQDIQDAIMALKDKTGVKFKFDPKLHCDFPVLAMKSGCDQKDPADVGRSIARMCREFFHELGEGIGERNIGQQFIAENCKTGSSCLRITHADVYHEPAFKEYGYCTVKWDDGDLVVVIRDYANTYEVCSGLDKLTTEPAEAGDEES